MQHQKHCDLHEQAFKPMPLLDDNKALRKALDLHVLVGQHRDEVEKLRNQYAHTIEFIRQSELDSSCVPYALGLSNSRTYRSIALYHNVHAGKDFAAWMLEGRLHEIKEPKNGCLVCYFFEADWKHIGIMNADGTATSKWGTCPLYKHALAEVPSSTVNK